MLKLNLTSILIIVAIALGVIAKTQHSAIVKEKAKSERLEEQYSNLEDNVKTLRLEYSELNSRQEKKIKQLADSLKIKPKYIDRVVEVVISDTVRDTIPVPVVMVDTNNYSFVKDTLCFHIEGIMNIENEVPKLSFTELQYNNNISYVVYTERKQWKFLFIKSRLFGKKEAKIKTLSTCGESSVEDIEIIKK